MKMKIVCIKEHIKDVEGSGSKNTQILKEDIGEVETMITYVGAGRIPIAHTIVYLEKSPYSYTYKNWRDFYISQKEYRKQKLLKLEKINKNI